MSIVAPKRAPKLSEVFVAERTHVWMAAGKSRTEARKQASEEYKKEYGKGVIQADEKLRADYPQVVNEAARLKRETEEAFEAFYAAMTIKESAVREQAWDRFCASNRRK